MRTVKPSGDFLVNVVTGGHEATSKVSDVASAAGLAQLVTDAAGNVVGLGYGQNTLTLPSSPRQLNVAGRKMSGLKLTR